jgi:drug/metabolite transporter (DMT)-like permease
MLAFSALVAGSFSLGGQIANEIDPAALNAVRFAIAAAAVYGGAACAGRATHGGPPSAAPWRYFLLGGLFAVYFVTMFEGLKTAPPVSAAAVFTLTPDHERRVFGWVLLRQGVTARIAVALAIGAAGAIWVIFRADWSAIRAFRDRGAGEADLFLGLRGACGCIRPWCVS